MEFIEALKKNTLLWSIILNLNQDDGVLDQIDWE